MLQLYIRARLLSVCFPHLVFLLYRPSSASAPVIFTPLPGPEGLSVVVAVVLAIGAVVLVVGGVLLIKKRTLASKVCTHFILWLPYCEICAKSVCCEYTDAC